MQIFDRFPEPVFLISPEGIIRYRNTAARQLEPDWAEDTPVPPALSLQPDGPGVFTCVLGGQSFQAACTPAEEGTILVLRPCGEVGEGGLDPGFLAAHLRQQIQPISLAAQLLAGRPRSRRTAGGTWLSSSKTSSVCSAWCATWRPPVTSGTGGTDLCAIRALDLAALCRDVAYGTKPLAQQAGVTFLASVPDGMLAATGDQSLLEQMLLELISNAIKAAGRDGQAGLKLSSTGRQALITVWDDGPGMDEGDLAALMGERSSLYPPKPGSGLGLGLAVARHIARLHDGALLLESKPGQGLQATVSLPVRRAPRGELNTPIREPEGGYPALLTGLADALPWQAFLEEV